jgi:hypothetical protein
LGAASPAASWPILAMLKPEPWHVDATAQISDPRHDFRISQTHSDFLVELIGFITGQEVPYGRKVR